MTTIYPSPQAQAVINFVREQYGNELEFLWPNFPTNSVWRNQRNQKWYGVMLRIPRSKLGLDSEEVVDVLDLKFDHHAALAFAASHPNIYPGYHMNKNNWITIILDGSVKTAEIFWLIDKSYQITDRLG